MDKKSKKILMHYMDDTKRKLLSFEEIAYAKEHGAILEDLSISHEEAIRILTQSLKCISLSDAASSFLYSLSLKIKLYTKSESPITTKIVAILRSKVTM